MAATILATRYFAAASFLLVGTAVLVARIRSDRRKARCRLTPARRFRLLHPRRSQKISARVTLVNTPVTVRDARA